MDDRDLDIVRRMYPGGTWNPYGIDPRISYTEIARQVGIGREALWSRFRRWSREGFFREVEVVPNVRIFDVHRYRVDVVVRDTSEAVQVLDRLGALDRVVFASSAFGDSTTARGVEVVSVSFVVDSGADPADWPSRVRRATGCDRIDGPFSDQPPEVPRALTPLDWRLLVELRSHRWRALAGVAQRLGVTERTVRRRRDAMLDARIISYVPHFNWAIHPSAVFVLFYRQTADRRGIVSWLERRFEHHLPLGDGVPFPGESYMGGDFDSWRFVGVRVPARSQAEVRALEVEFARLPGVTRVYNEVPGPMRFYPQWLARQLSARVAGSGTTRTGSTGGKDPLAARSRSAPILADSSRSTARLAPART